MSFDGGIGPGQDGPGHLSSTRLCMRQEVEEPPISTTEIDCPVYNRSDTFCNRLKPYEKLGKYTYVTFLSKVNE
jgi:hypothetical protein